jgi:hypothetical protein
VYEDRLYPIFDSSYHFTTRPKHIKKSPRFKALKPDQTSFDVETSPFSIFATCAQPGAKRAEITAPLLLASSDPASCRLKPAKTKSSQMKPENPARPLMSASKMHRSLPFRFPPVALRLPKASGFLKPNQTKSNQLPARTLSAQLHGTAFRRCSRNFAPPFDTVPCTCHDGKI